MGFSVVGVGHNCLDSICTIEDYPAEDGSTHITGIEYQGGGAAATAIATASRLGIETSFIGNIGFDKTSDKVLDLLRMEKVNTDHLRRRADCTGMESFVMVNPANGSRTKFPRRDSNPPVDFDEVLAGVIRDADYLHLDGTNYQNAVNAARIARKAGTKVSLDGCSMQADRGKNKALASMADILVMNARYPLRVSGKDNHEEALLEMATWGPQIVGCTLGDRGSLFVIDGKVKAFGAYRQKKVVDTTGCGDVFHGAFLSALVLGYDLEKAIRFASATASLKALAPGGRAGIPTREQVLRMIGE